MAQKPGCVSYLLAGIILCAMPFLICGGCFYGGAAIVKQADENNKAIEAAKSPEQKAKEKADKEEDELGGTLIYMGEQLAMKGLEYPQNSKLHRHAKPSMIEPNNYVVTGLVDVSNAFGVKKRMRYTMRFERKSKDADWNHSAVVYTEEQ